MRMELNLKNGLQHGYGAGIVTVQCALVVELADTLL